MKMEHNTLCSLSEVQSQHKDEIHFYFQRLWSQTAVNRQSTYPDASVGVCCSHKVVAVGFNTLYYDASVGVLNPPHE